MPKQISYKGQVHTFPDNFTDDDISAALTIVDEDEVLAKPYTGGYDPERTRIVEQRRRQEIAEHPIREGAEFAASVAIPAVIGKGMSMARRPLGELLKREGVMGRDAAGRTGILGLLAKGAERIGKVLSPGTPTVPGYTQYGGNVPGVVAGAADDAAAYPLTTSADDVSRFMPNTSGAEITNAGGQVTSRIPYARPSPGQGVLEKLAEQADDEYRALPVTSRVVEKAKQNAASVNQRIAQAIKENPNLTRMSSIADEEAVARAMGLSEKDIRQLYHMAGGAQSKGVQVTGKGVLSKSELQKALEAEMKRRYTKG